MLFFAGGDWHSYPEAEREANAKARILRVDPGPAQVVARVQVKLFFFSSRGQFREGARTPRKQKQKNKCGFKESFLGRHETQHNVTQHNDIQHKWHSAIVLSAIMVSVVFYLLLCWVSKRRF